ncbi:hypothetical protein Q1695_006921 [Nippostrongylus brasiliensis]|nr:hypothetical protein Q1695_006921 [Nippostrongylus brasiliensis]
MYPRREQVYGLPMDIKNYDPINAQLSIHMDVSNIFIRMAMIISDGGRIYQHIDKVTTDASGRFEVDEHKFWTPALLITILHKCNYHGKCVLYDVDVNGFDEMMAQSWTLDLSDRQHDEYCGRT